MARAAELHDVGKIAIPERVLHKRGALTAVERELIRKHTLIGERILAAAPAMVPVARLVRASHERWDGDGYPDRLSGDEIPIGARIIAVCDAFDAMVSSKPYRRSLDSSQALERASAMLRHAVRSPARRAVLRAGVPAGGRLGRGAPPVAGARRRRSSASRRVTRRPGTRAWNNGLTMPEDGYRPPSCGACAGAWFPTPRAWPSRRQLEAARQAGSVSGRAAPARAPAGVHARAPLRAGRAADGRGLVPRPGDRHRRHRPRRARDLPRARPARRLPDHEPEALPGRRPRVHPPHGERDHRRARRRRHRGRPDRGADRRVDARAAQDRVDRRAREPRRHDARVRDQRQQRPPAVRVDRARAASTTAA